MLRRMFTVVMALMLVIFGTNRVNYSKSIVTSNYLVLKSIESQNLHEIISSVRFYIPSFNLSMLHMNSSPYNNADGEVEVYIGDILENEIVGDSVNNNYLFNSTIEFNNEKKEVKVIDNVDSQGNIDTVSYDLTIIDDIITNNTREETVNLMTIINSTN